VNDEQTTGTPAPDDGDAHDSATTGTPEADGRDAGTSSGEPTADDYKALYLKQKSEVEEARRLKAELEQLRARPEPPPAAHDDDGEDDSEDDEGLLTDDERAELIDLANRGDRASKAALKQDRALRQMRQREGALVRNIADTLHLKDISDEAERREVYNHYARNRRRLGDIKAAHAEVSARKLAAENAKLRADVERLSKQPPRDVVRTHSREVTSSEAKARREMTYAEFDGEVARLKAAGRYREAMKLQTQLDADEIGIKKA